MLGVLQENSAENGKYLFNVVKTLKITEYVSNNAKSVVSLIHGVVVCLRNMVYARGQSALLDYFYDYLLSLFNTTSVNEFNALFEHYSIATRLTEFQTKMSNKPHIREVLSFAETQYRHPYSIEESSGVDTKIRVFSLLLLPKNPPPYESR